MRLPYSSSILTTALAAARSPTLKQVAFDSKYFSIVDVIVEVIASQIGEDRDVIGDAVNTLLLKCVRRHFHHRFGAARLQGAREELVQFERLGSGVRRGEVLVLNAILDRADQCGLASAGAQHRVQQKRCRGLTVCARNAGDAQLLGWASIEFALSRASACRPCST